MNVLQLTDEQVDALQSLATNGLPYARAILEQSCIAEVSHYCKHHTDFDDMVAIVENYRLMIQTLEGVKALVCNE